MTPLKKIIIVDDDPAQAELLKQWIQVKMSSLGVQADCLYSLDAARERLAVNNISLILLDLCFKDGDPYHTIPFIRDAKRQGFPVIITTGTSVLDSGILAECIAAGAASYWVKGSPAEELIQKIGFFLQKYYPESNAARVAVEAHRHAPKHFWEFPLSEGFGAKLAVLISFLTLLGFAWSGITRSYKTVEQQGRTKIETEQRNQLATVTAQTVTLHTQQFSDIRSTMKEVLREIAEISAAQREEKAALIELHDGQLHGKDERKAITDRLDRMDNSHKKYLLDEDL